MSLSFAIIGPKDSQNTLDLNDEILAQGHFCDIYNINEISINVANTSKLPFFSHDIYIFRGYNKSIFFAQSLATILHNLGKIVIDKALYTSTIKSKVQESILLQQNNIPQPQTFYARNLTGWENLIQHLKFPLIIKPIDGQQGQDIHLFSSYEETISFLTGKEKLFLAQQYIKSDGDIRVFIVNNKIIGAIKRFVVKNDVRANASLGAKTAIYTLSETESKIALSAHNCIGYDVSGVDIILNKDNNPFVLEVNHTPQWQAFKKTLNINPAQKIINFALQQYEEKNRIL